MRSVQHSFHRQKGLSLVTGMIMLVLISLMVTASFNLSTTNSKTVANMQFRDEVIAAANKGIEQTIGVKFPEGFSTVPAATSFSLDINNDGTSDYTVAIAIPECKQARSVAGVSGSSSGLSSASLSGFTASAPYWETIWDIAATVTDATSGATIEIHQGLRVALTEAQKTAVCP